MTLANLLLMWKDYIHVFLNFPSPKNIHYNLFGHPFKHYYNILSPYNIHTVKPGNIKFILVTGKNQLYIKSTLYQGSKYSENYYNVGFGYRPKSTLYRGSMSYWETLYRSFTVLLMSQKLIKSFVQPFFLQKQTFISHYIKYCK